MTHHESSGEAYRPLNTSHAGCYEMMSGCDVSSGPHGMGAAGGESAWSVVSAGLLRRMHTAVLVHLNGHMFALHLE